MLKCWNRKGLEVPRSCSTWGNGHNGKEKVKPRTPTKKPMNPWAPSIIFWLLWQQLKARSPAQERELAETLCQESSSWLPPSFKHILLSNRHAVGTCQCVTHCQSSTQTHPGEEWALCRVTAPKQTGQEETTAIITLPTCCYCPAGHCSSITQGPQSQE